jgi:uncharacterized membrane protein
MEMNEWIVLLSIVPGIEAMWSSAYFFCSGQLAYIPPAILLNFLGVVAFIKLVDRGMIPKRIEGFLEKRGKKATARAEKWFKRYGNVALFFLIAMPFTGVGSYTGSFIGRIFELKGARFYLMLLAAISFSVVFGFLIGSTFNLVFKC